MKILLLLFLVKLNIIGCPDISKIKKIFLHYVISSVFGFKHIKKQAELGFKFIYGMEAIGIEDSFKLIC